MTPVPTVLLKLSHKTTQQSHGIYRLESILEGPGLHAGEIQQAFDQPMKTFSFTSERCVILSAAFLSGHNVTCQEFCKMAKRSQRSAKFMRNRRDKIGLKRGHGQFPGDGLYDEV